MNSPLNARALALLCAIPLLFACATKPPAASNNTPAAVRPAQAVSSTVVPGSAKDFEVNVGDTVHFDYQRSDVRDDDRAVLQRQASWLIRYPEVRVTIQGNCDERGTRAYNLALGARRAEAVKSYLASLGVARERIETVSYGKERPVCAESSEACWARNRRATTVIAAGAA